MQCLLGKEIKCSHTFSTSLEMTTNTVSYSEVENRA